MALKLKDGVTADGLALALLAVGSAVEQFLADVNAAKDLDDLELSKDQLQAALDLNFSKA
jgi:hypothetical protein